MGEMINAHYSLVGKETLKNGPLVGDIGLKRPRMGISCALCDHGDEPSGSVKDEEFICQFCLIVQKSEDTAVGIRCADHATPLCPQKLALTSPTNGVSSVGIVRSLSKATEFSFSLVHILNNPTSYSLD
jgi:hypothetical protein